MDEPVAFGEDVERWTEWGVRSVAPAEWSSGRVSPVVDERLARDLVADGNAAPNAWQYEVVSRQVTRTRWEPSLQCGE